MFKRKRRCRKCGCTDNKPCWGNDGFCCHWVENDLCSECQKIGSPSTRLWIPADWVDESNPTMLDRADSYIEKQADIWWLRLPKDDPERDNEFYRMAVEPGQIVKFLWMERHGEISLILKADRTFITDQEPPSGTTHFYEYSTGAIAGSLKDLVEADETGAPLDPGEYDVMAYTWSDEIPMRFDVDAEGQGRFLRCAGVH